MSLTLTICLGHKFYMCWPRESANSICAFGAVARFVFGRYSRLSNRWAGPANDMILASDPLKRIYNYAYVRKAV